MEVATLTLELPEELTTRLRRAAAARHVTLTEYLRPVLEAMAGTADVDLADVDEEARLAAVDAAYGAFADIPGVDELRRDRQSEVAIEERRYREQFG